MKKHVYEIWLLKLKVKAKWILLKKIILFFILKVETEVTFYSKSKIK